jgi:hypothetical protein
VSVDTGPGGGTWLMVDHHHADTSPLTRAESKERMRRAWRRVTLVAALTGSAAIAAQLAAVVPAQAATPTITVAATSRIPAVTGDVFVIFKNSIYGSARIHGTITGVTAGEVATLYAQRFPYSTAARPVRSITLSTTGPTAKYSFAVAPTLATRYQVKVFARKSATTPLATSARQNLYVVANGYFTGGQELRPPGVPHDVAHLHDPAQVDPRRGDEQAPLSLRRPQPHDGDGPSPATKVALPERRAR